MCPWAYLGYTGAMEITIATWNIAGGHLLRSGEVFDYGPEEVGYFAEQLRAVDPDVVCLQETHRNATRSVAQEIADALGGYACVEQENSPSHIDPAYTLGNAVLSRLPILRSEEHLFAYPDFPLVLSDGRPAVRHEKGFQIIALDGVGVMNLQMQPLRSLGTPYDTKEGSAFARQMEVQLLEHRSGSMLVCGDFNVDHASELYPEFLEGMYNALPDAPTRPGNKRTDYLFASPEFQVKASGIIETQTDHYLCWATLVE